MTRTWAHRGCHIQSFGGEEGIFVKQIAGIIVRPVGNKSAAESIELAMMGSESDQYLYEEPLTETASISGLGS